MHYNMQVGSEWMRIVSILCQLLQAWKYRPTGWTNLYGLYCQTNHTVHSKQKFPKIENVMFDSERKPNIQLPQMPESDFEPQASQSSPQRREEKERGSPMRSPVWVPLSGAQWRAKKEHLVSGLVLLLLAGVGVKALGWRAARLQQEGRGSEAGRFDNRVIPQIKFFLLALQDWAPQGRPRQTTLPSEILFTA